MFNDRVPLKFSNTKVWDQFTLKKDFEDDNLKN